MRSLGKWLGRILLIIAVLISAIWLLGPREPVDTDIAFDKALTADTVADHFAASEAQVDGILPGVEKRVIWAGVENTATEIAVLYIHGFSATSEEIRPVPDTVAEALGANLIYTRLTGHGRDGAAMTEPTAGDWIQDVAEGLAAARALGGKTLVISTSTGGTLTALAALHPQLAASIDAAVFVSPNFAIANPNAWLLTLPAARWWLPLVAGPERKFEPMNEGQATYWTENYPTVAVLPMAALVKHVIGQDFAQATAPALFIFSDADAVVDAATTRQVAAAWGGDATLAPQEIPPGNDPYHHVIAGDILSPGMTGPVTRQILDWAAGHGF